MMCLSTRGLRSALAILAVTLMVPLATAAAEPVVKAIFFYMTTCGHCHMVITETLPPLMDEYGDRLEIAFVDVSSNEGNDFFYAAADMYAMPEESMGVPIMLVGPEILYGDVEIPMQLKQLIDEGLASGGIDWPDLPNIEAMVGLGETADIGVAGSDSPGDSDPVPTMAPEVPGLATATGEAASAAVRGAQLPDLAAPSPRDLWAGDPIGFGIALVVLVAMVASVIRIGVSWWRSGFSSGAPRAWQAWAVPMLCIVGIVIASYMGYVESTQQKAMCGPVGDCNAVQESEFALLFGILPVGILGIIGYLVILALWAWRRHGRPDWVLRLRWMLPLVLLFGVLYSIYLTYLELFVIGAVCMWCVSSAVTMTLLLWVEYAGWIEPQGGRDRPRA